MKVVLDKAEGLLRNIDEDPQPGIILILAPLDNEPGFYVSSTFMPDPEVALLRGEKAKKAGEHASRLDDAALIAACREDAHALSYVWAMVTGSTAAVFGLWQSSAFDPQYVCQVAEHVDWCHQFSHKIGEALHG